MASSAPPTPTSAALAPPPGAETNFNDPDTLWKWNVLCQTAIMVIVGIMFFLRTYVRMWVKRSWILEDCKSSFLNKHARSAVADRGADMITAAFVSIISTVKKKQSFNSNTDLDWTSDLLWPSEYYHGQAWWQSSVECDCRRYAHCPLCMKTQRKSAFSNA